MAEASAFFECGSLGHSASRTAGLYDGLEPRTFGQDAVPLAVERIDSSDFKDGRRFPAGSFAFDSALLMRGLARERHGRPAPSAVTAPACA